MRDTEEVPEKCTCGAALLADSRFCHKCGRPLTDFSPIVEEPEPAPEAPPPALAPSPLVQPAINLEEVGFHNSIAVRTAFLFGAAAALLSSMPVLQFGCFLWLLLSGFAAVYLYQRRARLVLPVRAAMRLGWITGVFSFAVMLIFFTISLVTLSNRPGGITGIYREQLNSMDVPAESIDQTIQLLESPAGITVIMLMSLLFLFVLFTMLPVLGGGLAARVSRKD